MSNKDLFKKFMCGMMSLAMIASASTTVLATTTETDFAITSASAGTEKTYVQLEAVVVEVINETSIMVDWFDSSYGRTVVYCDNMPNVSDGDKVFVISDGSFMESYPMQLYANKVFVFTETVTAISNNEDIENFLTQTEEQTEETTVLTAMREWVLGIETIIQIDSTYNRMKLSNGQILDCIDGAELNRYVEIYTIDYLIYKATCMDMDMENYVTLTSEERENLILPDEPLTTYSELNPNEEVTSCYVTEPTTVSSRYDDVTSYYSDIATNISSISDDEYEETYETTTTFEYHDSATYEMTTTLEYCDTGMNETTLIYLTTTEETVAVTDIANKQARGIVKEINDLGYVVEVGELLITVEKELIVDDELAVGDIIGFYGWDSMSIDETNPINWGENTEIMKITLGDVDGDSEVRILDIIEINKHIVGSASLSTRGKLSADIDNNGRITMSDNISIAMYLCKKITNLNDLSEDIPEETLPEETLPEETTITVSTISIITSELEPTYCFEMYFTEAEVLEVIDDNTFKILIDERVVTASYEDYNENKFELLVGDIVNIYNAGGCISYSELEKRYRIKNKRILGNANSDAEVNELDIEFINSYIKQGKHMDFHIWNNSDVNNDNIVDAKDVSLIEKYIAGEITSFEEETTPVETTEPVITSTELLTSISIITTETESYFYDGGGARVGEVLEIIDDNTARVFIYTLQEGIAYYGDEINLSVGDSVNVYSPGGYVTWEELCNSFEIISKRILGDANLDGEVNELDIELINSYIEQGTGTIFTNLNNGKWVNADVNNDYKVDARDISLIEQYIAGEISSIDDKDHELYLPILNIVRTGVIEVIDANNFIIPWGDGTIQITFSDTPELYAGDMVKLEWGGTDGPLEKRMISVTKVIRGDANMDGELNDLDAKYIRNNIDNGINFIFDQVFYADVNFDNEVTIDDAILIEKYIAGEITSFDEVDINEIEEIKLKEAFLKAMKDEEVIRSYINYLESEPNVENIKLQLIANVDGYSICFVPSVVFAEAYTIETYDGYTFFAYNIYSTSDTGLYLIKDSEVYTLADAYNLNIIDIKKIYNALPKENYNGEVVAVTDRTDRA